MSLWADTGESRPRFGSAPKGAAHLDAVERVKEWTRARFDLAEADIVLVSESAPSLPGFPPFETAVAFRTPDDTRYHFKLFKRVEDIAEGDLPPAWMKDALAANDGFGCECC